MSLSGRARSSRVAFTLIELLAVIAILALIVGILLPMLGGARDRSRALLCRARLHELSRGALLYAVDYGVFPPCTDNYSLSGLNTNQVGLDWLGVGEQFGAFVPGTPGDPTSGNPHGFVDAPKYGLLYRYTTRDERIILCPSEVSGPWIPNQIIGNGNGQFSYTMVAGLALRSPERIPADAHFTGTTRSGSTAPLFVEEHPDGCNNMDRDGAFWGGAQPGPAGGDKLVSRHGPFEMRPGILPGGSTITAFLQGQTNVAFADGHADMLKTNFGFHRVHEMMPGNTGVANNVFGLLYHYGIEYSLLRME